MQNSKPINSKLKKKNEKFGVSFAKAIAALNLPVVPIAINGTTFNMIVDTGSTSSCLNKKDFESLGIRNVKKTNTSLYGTTGKSPTYKIPLNFRYNGEDCTDTFVINDFGTTLDTMAKVCGFPVHGLLGSIFLNSNDYIIDYKMQSLYKK